MSLKQRTAIGCLVCILACIACVDASSLQYSPYASGTKRIYYERSDSWTDAVTTFFTAYQTPYLPAVGAPSMRFNNEQKFDRANIASLAQFEKTMADARAAKEAAELARNIPAETSPDTVSLTVSSGENEQASVAATNVTTGPSSTTISVGSHAQMPVAATSSAPVGAETILQYFEPQKDDAGVKARMNFVMPYQTEPPLMMDSKATYKQTEGGTENKEAAK